MSRKSKIPTQKKIELCQAYDKGEGSFESLGKDNGLHYETIRRWYLRYKLHGKAAFETSNKNRTYSKEVKDMIVNECINENISSVDLSAKYNINPSNIERWVNLYYNGIENKAYTPNKAIVFDGSDTIILS